MLVLSTQPGKSWTKEQLKPHTLALSSVVVHAIIKREEENNVVVAHVLGSVDSHSRLRRLLTPMSSTLRLLAPCRSHFASAFPSLPVLLPLLTAPSTARSGPSHRRPLRACYRTSADAPIKGSCSSASFKASAATLLSTHKMSVQWTYEEAIVHLNHAQTNASVLQKQQQSGTTIANRSFNSVKQAIHVVGISQDDLTAMNVIHITGSKGKGSTAAFTERLLRAKGYKTGLFSSPHLIEARERIRINGAPISRESFSRHLQEYAGLFEAADCKEAMPAYFTTTFLLALKVFKEEKIDVAILEVGIGGLFDATNIVKEPVITAIAHIGLEHTKILGDTHAKIAHQKCGIMKHSAPMFVAAPQTKETLHEFMRAKEVFKPLSLHAVPPLDSSVPLGIHGRHQSENAALALQLAQSWEDFFHNGRVHASQSRIPLSEHPLQTVVPEVAPFRVQDAAADRDGDQKGADSHENRVVDAISLEALASCAWPGRSEVLHRGSVTYYLDGAHTRDSCTAASEWLATVLKDPSRKGSAPVPYRILLFNCTHQRNPIPLMQPILERVSFNEGVFCPNVSDVKAPKADQISYNSTAHDALQLRDACFDAFQRLTKSSPSSSLRPTSSDSHSCLQQQEPESESQAEAHSRPQSPPHETESSLSEASRPAYSFQSISEALAHVNARADERGLVEVVVIGSLHLVGGVLGVLGEPPK